MHLFVLIFEGSSEVFGPFISLDQAMEFGDKTLDNYTIKNLNQVIDGVLK